MSTLHQTRNSNTHTPLSGKDFGEPVAIWHGRIQTLHTHSAGPFSPADLEQSRYVHCAFSYVHSKLSTHRNAHTMHPMTLHLHACHLQARTSKSWAWKTERMAVGELIGYHIHFISGLFECINACSIDCTVYTCIVVVTYKSREC